MLFLPQVMKIKGQLPLSITFNFPRLSIKPGKERVGIVRVRRMLRRKNSLGRIRFTLHWEWFSNHQYSVSQTSVKDPPPSQKDNRIRWDPLFVHTGEKKWTLLLSINDKYALNKLQNALQCTCMYKWRLLD